MENMQSVVSAERERIDVVIIGAGMCGLAAATVIDRAGLTYVVLESADKVGGRTQAVSTPLGSRIDLGGQWVGSDHLTLKETLSEFNLDTFKMHSPERRVPIVDGERVAVASEVMQAFDRELHGWETSAGGRYPDDWDQLSVADWIAAEVEDQTVGRLLTVFVEVQTTSDISRLSMAAWMKKIVRGGGFSTTNATVGGAQESLVIDGMGTLAEAMAEGLSPHVRLNERVLAIETVQDGVAVVTAQDRYLARQVISTIPTPMLERVEFTPELPETVTEAIRATYMGFVYKAFAVYDRPFWRDETEAESILLGFPGGSVYDASPPTGPGHLCFLIGGAGALALDKLSSDERRTQILTQLIPVMGSNVTDPVSWHEKSWHRDEHVGGGYGVQSDFLAGDWVASMRQANIDGVVFAGAEFAQAHAGYIDGAIENGKSAASEVISSISHRPAD